MSEKLDDKMIGLEVIIKVEHKGHGGVLRKVGEKANIYTGYTYGVLGPNEVPLIFNKELPFIGTDRKYIKIIKDK